VSEKRPEPGDEMVCIGGPLAGRHLYIPPREEGSIGQDDTAASPAVGSATYRPLVRLTDGVWAYVYVPRGSDSAAIGAGVAANEVPVDSDLLEKQG